MSTKPCCNASSTNTPRRSWSMREAAKSAAALSDQRQCLTKLQASIDSGNMALIGRITVFTSQEATSCADFAPQHPSDRITITGRPPRKHTRHGRSRTFRIPVPTWFVACVRAFGVHTSEGAWTVQLNTVNIRPAHTYVFDFVRAGDVGAVRELMTSGQLSIYDRQAGRKGGKTLLEVSSNAK